MDLDGVGREVWALVAENKIPEGACPEKSLSKENNAMKAEIKNLSQQDKDYLSQYIKDELDISSDMIEVYLEQALIVAISLLDLIPIAKKAKVN